MRRPSAAMIDWAQPWWWLLLLPVALILLARKHPRVAYSSLGLLRSRMTLRTLLASVPTTLCFLGLASLLTAMARPQEGEVRRVVEREGLDIMLVVDTSQSMETRDFRIRGRRLDRLQAAKAVLKEFIAARPDDRIGMVAFGEEAFTQVPLTNDHSGMGTLIDLVEIGIAGERATNIAAALGVGGSRLDELEAPSKILILLTDGRHNVTQGLQPIQAAEALAALGIKVYTIGIGADESQRQTIFGLMGPMAADLDEPTLRAVAETTGGAYFRASDTRSLTLIYDQIDQLEPTTAEVLEYTHHDERYHPWLLIGLALLVLQQLLAQTWLRRLP